MADKLLQTYVDEKFFVSTVKRECSTGYASMYYETMVFEWDKKTRECGKILRQEDGRIFKDYASKQHFEICAELLDGKQ